MNDHVHALVKPLPGFELSQIVHSWKSYTANRLQRLFGRKGTVWQKDYFDRIIVSWKVFMQKAEYIVNNPQKRWPDIEHYEWVGWWH